MTSSYVTIRLPKELVDIIDDIVKSDPRGYKSRAEFVKEAIRKELLERYEDYVKKARKKVWG